MIKVNLLPMGSLVYLKGGDMKLMIIARGPVFEDDHGETVYADYLGVPYPGGFQPDEGALTGAATGGPYGAAAGFLLGTANWGWGLADKVLGTNSKNDLYNKAEQGLGTVYDSFENSAKNYLNFLGKLAGA